MATDPTVLEDLAPVIAFLQYVMNGLAAGSLYALVALGIVLLYRCSRVLNFAHGELATLGVFLAFSGLSRGWPYPLALATGLAGAAVVSGALYWILVRPVRQGTALGVLITTLGCELFLSGRMDRFDADVIETIAPPPEGDNDLAESRRHLSPRICSKGNLSLRTLHDGTVDEVMAATREIARAVRGTPHIYSTADAVLPGTPPENFIAFVRTAREVSSVE